jgi:hypothetical protein
MTGRLTAERLWLGYGEMPAVQDIGTAWCTRWLVVMQEGRLVTQGALAAVLTPELVAEMFGMKPRITREEETGCLLSLPMGRRSNAAGLSWRRRDC